MSQSGIGTIGERLARLERENRRLDLVGVAITAGSLSLLFCGASDAGQDGDINCERPFLADKKKGMVIAIGSSTDREPVSMRRTLQAKSNPMDLRMFVAGDGGPMILFEDQDKSARSKIPR